MARPLTLSPALRVGLTGGIGSGKSTVAALLVQAGAVLVDSDAIARRLTLPGGQAIDVIHRSFGDAFIAADGSLDRDRMREAVFSDTTAKRRLEAILHPLIGLECERQASAAVAVPMIVFDVPLLVESGHWRSRVHKVLVVDCLETTQVDRVLARSGWSEQTVRAVMGQQASRAQRLACADAVLFNDGITLDELGAQVASLWQAWCQSGR